MQTLIDVISAVLSGTKRISELPDDKLIVTSHDEAIPCKVNIPQDFALKIARLQTLLAREAIATKGSSFKQDQSVAEVTDQPIREVVTQGLELARDHFQNASCLERIITQAVRNEFPGLSESQLNRVFYVDRDASGRYRLMSYEKDSRRGD